MTFQTVEQLQLQAQIATLTAENERLRALVEEAFEEGYNCDREAPADYFDHSWFTSDAFDALQPKEETNENAKPYWKSGSDH